MAMNFESTTYSVFEILIASKDDLKHHPAKLLLLSATVISSKLCLFGFTDYMFF